MFLDSFSLEYVVPVIVAIVIGAFIVLLYFFGGKLWTFLKRSPFRNTRYGSTEINSTALHREPPVTDPGGNASSEVEDQDANLDPNVGTSPTSSTASTDSNFTVDCPTQPPHSRSEPQPNAENSATNVLTSDEPLLQFVTPKVDVTPHDDSVGGRRCDERKVNSPSEDVMNKPRMAKSIHHTSAHVVGHEARECRSEEFTDPNILTIKSLMLYLPELASLGLQLSGWLDMGSAWAAIVKTPGTPQDHVQKLLTQWLSDEEDPDIPHTWTHFIEVVRGCKRGKLAGKMEREVLGIEVKPQVSQSAPPTVQRPSQVLPDSILDSRPTEPDINKLVGSRMSAEWDRLAMYLKFDPNTRQAIDRDNNGRCGRCFSNVFSLWLQDKEGTGDLPRTWKSVLQAVRDCGHRGLADDVSVSLSEGH